MAKRRFGIRDGGLPGPEEFSDEARRLKEQSGKHKKPYKRVEDIPDSSPDPLEELISKEEYLREREEALSNEDFKEDVFYRRGESPDVFRSEGGIKGDGFGTRFYHTPDDEEDSETTSQNREPQKIDINNKRRSEEIKENGGDVRISEENHPRGRPSENIWASKKRSKRGSQKPKYKNISRESIRPDRPQI